MIRKITARFFPPELRSPTMNVTQRDCWTATNIIKVSGCPQDYAKPIIRFNVKCKSFGNAFCHSNRKSALLQRFKF